MRLFKSTALALVIAAGFGLTAGAAGAFSVGKGETAETIVQHVAHRHNDWQWHGGWWRYGPWADHAIHGMVNIRPVPVFLPWGPHRVGHCAAKYRSFDPATGTYVNSRGERRICR